jgi:hypothetical protein
MLRHIIMHPDKPSATQADRTALKATIEACADHSDVRSAACGFTVGPRSNHFDLAMTADFDETWPRFAVTSKATCMRPTPQPAQNTWTRSRHFRKPRTPSDEIFLRGHSKIPKPSQVQKMGMLQCRMMGPLQ